MRRLRHALLTVGVSALLTLALGPAAAMAAPTGSITGTVTAAVTHLPIAGVRVCAHSEFGFEEEETFCALTAASGTYAIVGLPERSYRVEFLAGEVGLNYVVQYWKGTPQRFDATRVKVGAGEVPGIDAELTEGGKLGGRVTNFQSGAPLAGIEVCAESFSEVEDEGCAVTDANGEYLIVGLAGGRYTVQFWPPEDSDLIAQYYDAEPGELQADKVRVAAGGLTANVNATMVAGGRIGGTITDVFSHQPLAGAGVCTIPTLSERYASQCGETDAAGHYLIRKVPAGVYGLQIFVPQGYSGNGRYTGACGNNEVFITVAAGQLTGGIDVGLFPSGLALVPARPECETTVVEPPPKPKPKKCRKGAKLKKVKGKKRCVKVRKHHPRKHHRTG